MSPWFEAPPWVTDHRAWRRAALEVAEATRDHDAVARLRTSEQLGSAADAFAALGVSAAECARAFDAFAAIHQDHG